MRMRTAKLAKTIKIGCRIRASVSRFGGLLKFDNTSGGGFIAGPFKSASSSAREKFVGIFVHVF